MLSKPDKNIAVVLNYFNGCNTGDLEDLLSTLDPDVTHYFLPNQFKEIRTAEHLARYCRKYKNLLHPPWRIDHIIAQGNEVVSEWSCFRTPEGTNLCLIMRGSEWYVMRDGGNSFIHYARFVACLVGVRSIHTLGP